MKTKTNVLMLIAGLLILINPGFAQSDDDYIEVARDVLQSEKKVVIAEVMMLTDAESAPFWELYNEYNAELYKVHTERVKIIKDFAENYESMTNEKADELWTNSLDFQGQLLKLNKSYYKKFKKILPAGKAAMYFQAENKIAALINAELALDIPLIDVE